MPEGQTKKQHIVPRFYLAGFADRRGQLATRMRNGYTGFVTIKRATVRNDYYTFYTDDGARNQGIEDWFATDVEGPVTAILQRLRDGGQPEPGDTMTLARFVTTSMLRTATVRSYTEQIDLHMGPMLVVSGAAKRAGINLLDATSADIERYMNFARQALETVPADELDVVRSRLRTILRKSDEITARLASWTWRCEHTTEPAFITADAPVATLDPLLDGGWHGIIPPGSPVFMPISSTHLLVGDPAPLPGTSVVVSRELVEMVNTTLARGSYDAIFTHPEMEWPSMLQLASKRPQLPVPNITLTASPPGTTPTFPATHDPVIDPVIDDLLTALGATDTIQ